MYTKEKEPTCSTINIIQAHKLQNSVGPKKKLCLEKTNRKKKVKMTEINKSCGELEEMKWSTDTKS